MGGGGAPVSLHGSAAGAGMYAAATAAVTASSSGRKARPRRSRPPKKQADASGAAAQLARDGTMRILDSHAVRRHKSKQRAKEQILKEKRALLLAENAELRQKLVFMKRTSGAGTGIGGESGATITDDEELAVLRQLEVKIADVMDMGKETGKGSGKAANQKKAAAKQKRGRGSTHFEKDDDRLIPLIERYEDLFCDFGTVRTATVDWLLEQVSRFSCLSVVELIPIQFLGARESMGNELWNEFITVVGVQPSQLLRIENRLEKFKSLARAIADIQKLTDEIINMCDRWRSVLRCMEDEIESTYTPVQM